MQRYECLIYNGTVRYGTVRYGTVNDLIKNVEDIRIFQTRKVFKAVNFSIISKKCACQSVAMGYAKIICLCFCLKDSNKKDNAMSTILSTHF